MTIFLLSSLLSCSSAEQFDPLDELPTEDLLEPETAEAATSDDNVEYVEPFVPDAGGASRPSSGSVPAPVSVESFETNQSTNNYVPPTSAGTVPNSFQAVDEYTLDPYQTGVVDASYMDYLNRVNKETHKVQPGETLVQILKNYGYHKIPVPMSLLLRHMIFKNGLNPRGDLTPGQVIILPYREKVID